MADIRKAFGTGGGGGSAKKTKLVADLTAEYEKLNRVLSKTEQFSKNIFENLKKAKDAGTGLVTGMGGGGNGTVNGAASSMNFPANQFVQPPNAGGGSASSSMSGGGTGGKWTFNAGTFALGATAALSQAVNPATYIENDIARRRFAFFNGQGNTAANNAQLGSQFQRMMNAGTSTDTMDAARAAMSGLSNGLMAGIQQKSGVFNTVTGVSNMVPGAGLEGGMNAAAALNSAGSVNKLRMLGVKVRDDNGMPRELEAIARDIWNKMNGSKTGSGKITKDDLDRSLMDGNSLDSMLDQYFSGDPVLRQGVVSYLYQFASGSPTTKAGMKASNANPAIAQSISARNASGYKVDNAYTTPGVEGIMAANTVLAGAAELFASSVGIFGGIVTAMAAIQTLAGGAGGAAGTLGGSLLGSVGRGKGGGGAASPRGKNAPVGPMTKGQTRMANAGARFKGGAKLGGVMALGSALLDTPGNIEATNAGKGGSAWGGTIGSAIGGVAGAAIGQALIPIPVVGGLVGGMVGGWLGGMAGEAIGSNFDAAGGEGVGGEGVGGDVVSGLYNPLKGSMSTPNNGEFGNYASFRSRKHRGQDYRAKDGTPVYSIKKGKVVKSGVEGDLGNMVRIKHPDGYSTVYAHLSSRMVSEGAEVDGGTQIGLSGYSGGVSPAGPAGAHLHIAVEKGGEVFSPGQYLTGSSAPTALGVYTGGSSGNKAGETTATPSGQLFNFSGGGNSLFSGNVNSTAGEGVGGEGVMGSGGGVNYGGVTVHINVPKGTALDEHKLAREVKRILQDEEQLRMAVIR